MMAPGHGKLLIGTPTVAALSRHPPRGAVWLVGQGHAEPSGCDHFRIKGKRDKIRFVPAHAMAQRHPAADRGVPGRRRPRRRYRRPVFRPVTNNRTGNLDRPLSPGSVYHNIVRKYGLVTGVSAEGLAWAKPCPEGTVDARLVKEHSRRGGLLKGFFHLKKKLGQPNEHGQRVKRFDL
jgi:hypothetical protein